MLTKIAFRNVFRNSRRTCITMLVLVFGVVALMLFGGYKEVNFWGIREGRRTREIRPSADLRARIFRSRLAEAACSRSRQRRHAAKRDRARSARGDDRRADFAHGPHQQRRQV